MPLKLFILFAVWVLLFRFFFSISFIKFSETFKTFPIDPLIQLSCKRVYRIPNTSFRINPKSVVLIPVNVLQTDNNLYPSMDSSDLSVNQEMEKEYAFITDSEMQSFFVFGKLKKAHAESGEKLIRLRKILLFFFF